MTENRALREVGNAIQDAVAAEVHRANAGSGLPAISILRDARLAEIGMTGSFEIDLADGRHFTVRIS